MKIMRKLLLIHWHYFTHETIDFDKLNFLTGKNASGKSTIIDALQLILLGDTSGSFFNKAASGRGNRTLTGYLRGELGDDEDLGFKYLRNGRFTSYIALEFFDEEKKKTFTAGCCFDTYSENDMQKLFFLYDGAIPDNEFIEAKTPMEIVTLRAYLKERYAGHHYTTDVGRDFRTNLYGKLGGLRDRFGQLLKKAVSFNPNVEIQQFISEFVCDTQQTVDVSRMQENIRSYKNLEGEADVLKDRIVLLEQILTTHQSFTTHRQNEKLYSYLIERSQADMKTDELGAAKRKAKNYVDQLSELAVTIETETTRLNQLQEERDMLQAKLLNDEQAQALQLIDAQIAEKEQQIRVLRGEYDKAVSALSKCVSSWRMNTDAMLQKIGSSETALLDPVLVSRISDLCVESQTFLRKIEPLLQIDSAVIIESGENGLNDYSALSDALKVHSIELASRMGDEQNVLAKRRGLLQQEKQSLESGIYHFPQDVLDLKDAVSSRLRVNAGKDVKVLIVAEASEIKNDRWRNVIEGYLNTQKYYIIVPQGYFQTALRVFDSIKRQKAIYGTGIVDIEKLARINPMADPGSLAEEIETDEPNIRLFLDYTLGRVKKCDRIGDLRQFRTSVTDEGMLYQNFVVRAMNPDRWAKPAIGQGAIQRRLEDVKKEIDALVQQITACATVKIGLQLGSALAALSQAEVEHAVSSAKGISAVAMLENDMKSLRESRDAIDRSAVDALKERINTLGEMMKTLGNQLETHKGERSTWNERLRVCYEETIPKLTGESEALEAEIIRKYDEEWLENTGRLRYQRELSIRGNAEDINRAFPRELSRSTNARVAMWDELVDLRRTYNDKYIMGYDIKAENNDAYDNAWLELSENKLPEYLTRIEDTRKKAFEQFQEDFLSRLQNNINDAKRQIDGINSAIIGSHFGEDTYRFRIVPKPEYKRYYDMIVDPMLLEGGYNLLSEQFNSKYKDEIADLFAIITNEGTSAKAHEHDDYEKRVQAFTDYRTYLSFDLEVIDRDGEAQRLSKTFGKKSGGETQTPFYIAVLASFAQLYRIGRDKNASTSRLIIFDEAFSKMDGERIVRSIELLRQLNFQVVLSAPPDKIGDIATLVDRNLCVLRERKRACVRSFDPKRLEEIEYE
jgi:energy-coupling factor transporter ATP-binding protein EcfA2